MSDQDRTIEDGFGGCYQKCDDPQCELEVVRPGKVQCNKCTDREGRYVLDTRTNTSGFLGMDTMVSVIEQQVEKIDTLESELADLKSKALDWQTETVTQSVTISKLNTELAATKRECEGLRVEQGKAWGIEFCCSGNECGCQGQPIHPPPWWEDFTKKIAHLEAENARLREVAGKCMQIAIEQNTDRPCGGCIAVRVALEQALAARDATEGGGA